MCPVSRQVNLQVQLLTEHYGTPEEWPWPKNTRGRVQQCNSDQSADLLDVHQRVAAFGRASEVGSSVQHSSSLCPELTLAADPVLSGIAVAETIKGMQDTGIIASVKHFIGNEQERFRQVPVRTLIRVQARRSYSLLPGLVPFVAMRELTITRRRRITDTTSAKACHPISTTRPSTSFTSGHLRMRCALELALCFALTH